MAGRVTREDSQTMVMFCSYLLAGSSGASALESLSNVQF